MPDNPAFLSFAAQTEADSRPRHRPPLSRLAVNQTTTYHWGLPEEVACCRELGVSGIGLWRPKLSEFGEERGIELLRESGLQVTSLSWAGGFTGSCGHTYAEALDDARDAIRVAGALGAGCLVVVSGARNGHTVNHARRCLADAMNILTPVAAEHGVRLAVQPMHAMFARQWSFLTTLEASLKILEHCDRTRVGLAFDVYHLWQQPRLLERIPEIAERVAVVQLSDWREPPRSEHDRCLPGDGEIPLPEIVESFEGAGYDGFYELGIWSEELWQSDYQWLLQECLARYRTLWNPGGADGTGRS